jgi:Zn-dependent peptidase ImmA (M78 family)
MFFKEERIVIDESLDPEEHPAMEGRYRFTLAHEGGGHWRLHRRYFKYNQEQTGLFEDPVTPSVICRSSHVKNRVEWQADYYASCLLMPRKPLFAAWEEMFPDRKQRVIAPSATINHPFVEVWQSKLFLSGSRAVWTESINEAFERTAQPLAEQFRVSPPAMRIRLEGLGLLLREMPDQYLLSGM